MNDLAVKKTAEAVSEIVSKTERLIVTIFDPVSVSVSRIDLPAPLRIDEVNEIVSAKVLITFLTVVATPVSVSVSTNDLLALLSAVAVNVSVSANTLFI